LRYIAERFNPTVKSIPEKLSSLFSYRQDCLKELTMNAKKFVDLSQKILTPGRSLLLPMLLLALGLHAALLAMPIPSNEAMKEAEDKKNPITVSQIPTDQPTPATTASSGTVNVPDMPAPPTVNDSSSATPATTETSASTPASSTATTPAFVSKPTQSSSQSSVSSVSSTDTSTNSSSSDMPAPETAAEPEPTATVAVNSSAGTANRDNPFAEFPHFQPSEADCYGLGFGENCRVVDKGAIAQVTDYFKKELTAKDFTATLVADEPTRKVFKVTKGDKTLFLNIWQGNGQVSYLLSRVVVKQAPADIKTDTEK
jgi:hypothetical protein